MAGFFAKFSRKDIHPAPNLVLGKKAQRKNEERGMKEWRECRLSDVIELIGGGTPKTSIPEFWDGDIPWLSVVDFNNGKKYVSKTEKYITNNGLKNSSTKLLNKNDIIISARGTVGVIAMLSKPMTFNQSCYGIRAINDISCNDFVYYLLKDTVSNFQQIAHGGVFDTITRETFDNIDIFLPPLPKQKAIAGVLSSLDDKIDLLHRQNKTLEAMAEALFRQWFVEEADKGWEVGLLGTMFEISSGKGLKQTEMIENGQYPVLGANGQIGTANSYLYCDKLIYTGRVGTLGKLFIIDDEKVWLSDNTLIFTKIKSFYFVYFLLKMQKLEELNVGSTQPLIRQSDIKEIEILIPPKKLLEKYESIAQILFEQIKANQTQIRALEKLRDTLLPKLMSGEVRVDS